MPPSLPIRIFVCLLLLRLSAAAQFESIAIDGTAANIWFSSTLRLKGDDGPANPLIYQAGSAGISLFSGPTDEPATRLLASVTGVSDDGDVVAWLTAQPFTPTSSATQARIAPQIGIITPRIYTIGVHRYSDNRDWTFSEAVSLSRNGRWVWTTTTALDLQTGQSYSIAPAFRIAPGVSDEGDAVVLQEPNVAGLLRPGGQFRPLPESVRPAQVILMDRHAATLVWSTGSSALGAGQLKKLDVATGAITVLVDNCPNCEPLQLSADGRRVLVATRSIEGAAGVWVLDTLTQQRTDLAAGYGADAAITSSGQIACYSGTEGMLQCRDLESGDVRTVVGKTPQVVRWPDTPDAFPAPSSRYTLKGSGLEGAAVSVNGTPARVTASSATAITFLVPEEVEPGQAKFSFEQEASPFQSSLTWELRAIAPRVIKLSEIPGTEAIWWLPYLENGTRGGLAGEFQPLQPGEVVWIHMVGLGRDPSLMQWYWQDWIGGPLHDVVAEEITKDDGWYTVKIRIPETAPNGISVIVGQSPWDPSVAARVEIPVAH
ncbi:hypothetical protein [Paludibaculum fermentans]|uniref:hypothetical protein n=1 Tax=Paludibaculum fermentans TaxID=1473598 RepID=UPI003EC128AC